jgi:hypothetical protein
MARFDQGAGRHLGAGHAGPLLLAAAARHVDRFVRWGGEAHDWDPVIRQALQTAPAAAQKALIAEWPKVGRSANGWVMNTDSGVYGANYLKRGAVAMFEIGMNLPEDSIYPDTGTSPMDGRNRSGKVHRAPTPRQRRDTLGGVLRSQAQGGTGCGRGNVAGLKRISSGSRTGSDLDVDRMMRWMPWWWGSPRGK